MADFVVAFPFWVLASVVAILGYPFAIVSFIMRGTVSYFSHVYKASAKAYNEKLKNGKENL